MHACLPPGPPIRDVRGAAHPSLAIALRALIDHRSLVQSNNRPHFVDVWPVDLLTAAFGALSLTPVAVAFLLHACCYGERFRYSFDRLAARELRPGGRRIQSSVTLPLCLRLDDQSQV